MNEHELRREFETRRPALEAMGCWVTETILSELEKQLGSKAGVSKFLQIPPKPRVKETDSFLEKALVRKPKRILCWKSRTKLAFDLWSCFWTT